MCNIKLPLSGNTSESKQQHSKKDEIEKESLTTSGINDDKHLEVSDDHISSSLVELREEDNISVKEITEDENKVYFEMTEPENTGKFDDMAKSLESFEQSLVDLPPADYIEKYQHSVSSSSENAEQTNQSKNLSVSHSSSHSNVGNNSDGSKTDYEIQKQTPEEVKDSCQNQDQDVCQNQEPDVSIETVQKSNNIGIDNMVTTVRSESDKTESEGELESTIVHTTPNTSTQDKTQGDSNPDESSHPENKTHELSVGEHDMKTSIDNVFQDKVYGRVESYEEEEDSIYSNKHSRPSLTSAQSIEEDFYKQYGSIESPSSPLTDPVSSRTLDEKEQADIESSVQPTSVHEITEQENMPNRKFINNWTEIFTSGNIISMSLSVNHVWIVDKSGNILYSDLKGTGIKWQKVKDAFAKQLSVSPNGTIVWRLYKDKVYAGTKITPKRPEGMKWVEALKDVQYIAVDDNSAW